MISKKGELESVYTQVAVIKNSHKYRARPAYSIIPEQYIQIIIFAFRDSLAGFINLVAYFATENPVDSN